MCHQCFDDQGKCFEFIEKYQKSEQVLQKQTTIRKNRGELKLGEIKQEEVELSDAEINVSHTFDSSFIEKMHTAEKPYKCPFCDKHFTRKQSRVVHERSHTGEKPYKCDKCGKAFATNSRLNVHERRHTAINRKTNNYACHMCNKPFAITSYLT